MRWMLAVVLMLSNCAVAQQVQSVTELRNQFKNSRARENKLKAATALNQKAMLRLSPKDKSLLREIAVDFANDEEILELRIIAAVMLSNVGTKDDAATINSLLDDSEARVRSAALRAARKVNDDGTVKAILENVTKHGFSRDPHPAEVLAVIGTPAARQGLELLYEKSTGANREMAAKALDELDKKKH
jgi:HEAT repeat protein